MDINVHVLAHRLTFSTIKLWNGSIITSQSHRTFSHKSIVTFGWFSSALFIKNIIVLPEKKTYNVKNVVSKFD